MGRISNRYRYPTLDELKCPILILQGFNSHEDGCKDSCCRPDLWGFRSFEEEDEHYHYYDSEDDHEDDPEYNRQ